MIKWSYPIRCIVVILVLVVGSESPSWAGRKIVVGAKVPRNQRVSIAQIDHAAWDALLQTYVDAEGDVDYTAWKRRPADVEKLDKYLATLSTAERTLLATKASRLAFWINAYNAVTIRGILREYPTTSIRKHTAYLYGYNIWKDLLLQVGDIQISLEDIENKLLRKMGEPRIHFAVVCASRSCPRLANRAYLPRSLDKQLTRNTKHFFANPSNFRYDRSRNRFYLSEIFDWFDEDFGTTSGAQLRWIAIYLPDTAAVRAAQGGNVRVSYLDYDWSLNDQAKKRRTARR